MLRANDQQHEVHVVRMSAICLLERRRQSRSKQAESNRNEDSMRIVQVIDEHTELESFLNNNNDNVSIFNTDQERGDKAE